MSQTQTVTQQHRLRIRRKAIKAIRRAIDAVPTLGDPLVFLSSDAVARDAVWTLNALGWSPALATEMVASDRYTEDTHVRLVARCVTGNMLELIDHIKECQHGQH